MAQLYSNNATSRLVAPITNVALTLQVSAGTGLLFPNPTGGDFFLLTLYKLVSGIETANEIVKVTARATDVFTIIRAQEGTAAIAFAEADWVQHRSTAAKAIELEAHLGNVANPHTVTKTQVGLANADNTSDVNKPVSTAGQTALDLKADLASPTFTGTVGGITKSMVGLGSADNTADSAKPISTATQTALNAKADIDAAGNLGLGYAPTVWNSTWRTFSASRDADFGGSNGGAIYAFMSVNARNPTDASPVTGTGWVYKATSAATKYEQYDGNHRWYTAPGGTAGNSITFTERMNVTTAGLAVTGVITASGTITAGSAANYSFTANGTASRYIGLMAETTTYAGALVLQAGGGSSSFGGSLTAFGHSHATKPGWVAAGISAGSSGKFSVQTGAIGTGTDVFTVSAAGTVGIPTTQKFYLDSVLQTGDTYLVESSSNVLDMYAGGANTLRATSSGVVVTGTLSPTGAIIGNDAQLSRAMLIDCGHTFLDKGNSSTTLQTLDFTAGSHQRVTATGNHTYAFSNWPPTGNTGFMMFEMTNYGAYTITHPTVNWALPAGGYTTTFSTYMTAVAAAGGAATLQSSGTNFIVYWTRDAGTTVYGKLVA